MPWVRGNEKPKANWVDMNKFRETFDLKKTKAYGLVKLPEMQEAVRRFGKRTIRVNLPVADEILRKIF